MPAGGGPREPTLPRTAHPAAPVRIALLAHARHPIVEPFAGGLEAHTSVTADALVARGHEVTLFAQAGSVSRAEVVEIVEAGLRYGRRRVGGIDAAELRLDEAYETALDVVALGDFDVVLDNTLSPVTYRREPDLPTLTVLHTPATLERTNAVIDAGWEPGPLRRHVAVSAHTQRDWQPRLPAVGRVLNGIDLRHWHPDPVPTSASGRRRTPASAPYAVWSGRITPEKGLDVAIDAARLAGWPIRFGGPVSDPAYFAAEIEPRLGPDATYVGHLRRTELRAFLAAGSVLLFSPRWEEPFGLAAVEAMACGTPVAALPAGAAAEVVDRRAGVLARREDAASLAVALHAAARLDRRRVRASALRFDAERMVTAYERLLTGAVRGPGRRVDELV